MPKKAPMSAFNLPNAARTFASGVMYQFNDELEAAIRAAASGDMDRYREIVNQIRAQQEQYAKDNPKAATALELTGLVGGAALTPQLLAGRGLGALSRAMPRATKFVAGGIDDALQGAMYSLGQANTLEEAPQTIREEAPVNAAFYAGASGVGAAGKKALGKVAQTSPGYNALMKLRRRYMGY